ncbi:FAD-binding oxidoreductase [bacterium]|nr:FAD-binding oxidoreductase [bacterium]
MVIKKWVLILALFWGAYSALAETESVPRVTPEEQEQIYEIEKKMAPQMSPTLYQKFQMYVAKIGGKLKGRLVMPVGGVSHWLKKRHPILSNYRSTKKLPQLVDVAIIGSGLGGTAAAERLSDEVIKNGLIVAVLDARGVAEGATSQNGGNFQPSPENFIGNYQGLLEERYKRSKENYPELSEAELRDMAEKQALTILKFGAKNGKLFKEILQKYNIDPDLSDKGWMRLANSKEEELALQRDVELARSVGVYMEIWSAEKITTLTGIQTEFAGRFTPGYGNYHPYKFATGVFENLIKKGILLYTQTRVKKINWNTPLDQPVLLETSRGPLLAKKVIVATDAYTSKLIPEMKDLIEPFQSQVVTYEHVLDKLGGWTLTERDGDLYGNIPKETKYVDQDGVTRGMYLVGGGPDRLVADADAPPLSQEMFDVIVSQSVYRFPELAGQPPSNTWTAVFAFTPLRLPYLSYVTHDGVYDPRVIISAGSQGYGGGMSLMGGHLAAEMALLPPERAEQLLLKYDPYRFFELPSLKSAPLKVSGALMCRSLFAK